MKLKTLVFTLTTLICATGMQAQESSTPKYRRSSIYSMMLHSKATDEKLDKETSDNLLSALIDRQAVDSVAKSVAVLQLYPTIPVPDQFDNMNLEARIIEFDDLTIRDEFTKQAQETTGKKKGGFGKMLGSAVSGVTSGSNSSLTLPGSDDVLRQMPAAAMQYLADNNVAAELVAKWYNYQPTATNGTHYNTSLIGERGLYSASAEETAAAVATLKGNRLLMDDGENLIGHTYVIVNYLRYRSNEALINEIRTYADALGASIGGTKGMLAAKAAGAAASAIGGKGFSVQTNTFLFRLDWNSDVQEKFYTEYWNKDKSDLIESGLCKLTYVGAVKNRAGVRAGLGTKKSQNELIETAVRRSIDESVAKLQEEHEDFRVISPITAIDKSKGEIYASIGLKEGIEAGDVYEVLEPQEDPDTKVVTYVPVAKVKAVENQIYDNRAGAAEAIAEDLKSDDEKVREAAEAVKDLQRTTFSGKVKEEYAGYYLRLLKKK